MTRKILFIVFVIFVVAGIALLTVQSISKTDQTSGEKVVAQKGKYKIILKKVIKKEKNKNYLKISENGVPLIVTGKYNADFLEFYDETGKLLKKYEHLHCNTEISETGKFVIYRYATEWEEDKGAIHIKTKILNDKGEFLWERDDIYTSTFWVTDDGTIITPPGMYANLAFYKDGKLIREIEEISEAHDLSKNGKYVVGSKSDIDGSQLYLFDTDGNIIWKKRFKEERIYLSGISSTGKYIGDIGKNYTKQGANFYLLNNESNILFNVEIPDVGDYEIRFSKNEKYLAIISSRNEVYYFDIDKRSLLWKYQEQDSAGMQTAFMDAEIDDNGDIIVLSASARNLEDVDVIYPRKIIWLNKNKEILHKEIIDAKLYRKEYGHFIWKDVPSVKYDGKKKRVKIERPDQFESYEVNSIN